MAPHNPSAAEHAVTDKSLEDNSHHYIEKRSSSVVHEEDVVDAAARGHAATDAHGECDIATFISRSHHLP